MKQFGHLFDELDSSTSTNQKVAALIEYFKNTTNEDAAWAVYFLGGGKPKRTVPTATLRQVALQASGLPAWLFEESYQAVGDLAETISLVLPQKNVSSNIAQQESLAWWVENRILPMRQLDENQRIEQLLDCWQILDTRERFLFVKLVGGGFRVGVSKHLLTRALAKVSGLDPKVIATRMMGYHDSTHTPTAQDYLHLIAPASQQAMRLGQPFPFFLAHPLQEEPGSLGEPNEWLVEWKYDGIRAQIVKQDNQVWVWSRGEELVSEQFPELLDAFSNWPDGTVLDGEILVWLDGKPAGFSSLQTRLNRKRITPKLRSEAPVLFMAYDCLMHENRIMTECELTERRQTLELFVHQYRQESLLDQIHRLTLSEKVQADSWEKLAELRKQSRALGVEGFMLKQWSSLYGVGRTKAVGTWYKWKVDPMTVDCVLVYAQRGHGRRASLYTDYTFAVWDRVPETQAEVQDLLKAISNSETMADTTARGLPCLVPFAKAYSGLTDEEFKQVDREIRKKTVNKFGPVRTVVPSMVFEIGFEAIARSNRHKSGVAVRFPRMLRIRQDKQLAEADSLNSLTALLPATEQREPESP